MNCQQYNRLRLQTFQFKIELYTPLFTCTRRHGLRVWNRNLIWLVLGRDIIYLKVLSDCLGVIYMWIFLVLVTLLLLLTCTVQNTTLSQPRVTPKPINIHMMLESTAVLVCYSFCFKWTIKYYFFTKALKKRATGITFYISSIDKVA